MTVSLTFGARGLPNKDRFSKSDPFLVLFVLPEAGRPPKFVQRTETLKVGAKKSCFYKFDPEQPESWLESLGSVRGSCGLEQEMRFAEVGKKSSEAESRQWSQVRGAWWRWRRESGTPWQLCREHRAGFNLNNMQVATKPTSHQVSQSNIIIPLYNFPKVEEASKQQQRLGLKVLNLLVDNNFWYT